MFHKALVLLSGNAAFFLLTLARNLLVARLIPVPDYGVAATFGLVMALVEMSSAIGLHQLIVQAKEGDDPRFQAALQGFQVLRGLASGAFLFFISRPFAEFMGIGEVAWAYEILAVVPVLNALQHFDIHRLNRQMRFGPLILTSAVPAGLSLLAVWPLALWLGDWQVMLWAIVIQACIAVLTSHLCAERCYRLVFDPKIIRASLRFGWPLLVNSVLMFLVFQGDKLIVGRVLGMETLAIFSMGVTLTLSPTLAFAGAAQSLFLPRISHLAHQGAEASRERNAHVYATFRLHILFAATFVLGTALFGEILVIAVLGDAYLPLVPLIVPMAVLQGLRVFKGGPSTIAVAFGQTTNPMVANLFRVGLLPLGYFLAVWTGDTFLIVLAAILGELLGFIAAFWLTHRLPVVFPRAVWMTIGTSLLFMAVALIYGAGLLAPVPGSVLLVMTFTASLWPMHDLLADLVRRLSGRGGA